MVNSLHLLQNTIVIGLWTVVNLWTTNKLYVSIVPTYPEDNSTQYYQFLRHANIKLLVVNKCNIKHTQNGTVRFRILDHVCDD